MKIYKYEFGVLPWTLLLVGTLAIVMSLSFKGLNFLCFLGTMTLSVGWIIGFARMLKNDLNRRENKSIKTDDN